MYHLGIDLGGTNIVAGIVNGKYEIVAKASCKTAVPRPETAPSRWKICGTTTAPTMAEKVESVCTFTDRRGLDKVFTIVDIIKSPFYLIYVYTIRLTSNPVTKENAMTNAR